MNEDTRISAVYRSEIDPDLSGRPKFQNIGRVLEVGLDALGLLDQNIDVKFKVPEQLQLGYYQGFKDDWSFTLDAMWINMSAFGINHVSVNSDMTSGTVSVDGNYEDTWLFSAGLRHQYRPDLAFSVGGMYLTPPSSDGSVMAGSIRCQGEIIQDAQMKPVTEAQVREKCGKPAAEDFRMLTYKTEANVTKVLRFNDAGELESITEELGE